MRLRTLGAEARGRLDDAVEAHRLGGGALEVGKRRLAPLSYVDPAGWDGHLFVTTPTIRRARPGTSFKWTRRAAARRQALPDDGCKREGEGEERSAPTRQAERS